MKQKKIYLSKYFTIDWYYEGVFFGVGKFDDMVVLIIPFVIIEINIPKKRKPNEL
jgi:hypothetical protein